MRGNGVQVHFTIHKLTIASRRSIVASTIAKMNFELPNELKSHIKSIDSFIQSTILPLQDSKDNNRFFDHRREHARTDWDNDGNPHPEWESLLGTFHRSKK